MNPIVPKEREHDRAIFPKLAVAGVKIVTHSPGGIVLCYPYSADL